MEPLFKNVTKYTLKNYKEFSDFHSNKFAFSQNLYTLLFSLLLIYFIIYNIINKNLKLILLFILLLFIFLIIKLYFPYKMFKKSTAEIKKVESRNYTFNFYKFYFTIEDKRFYYFKLYRVCETNDFFYLYASEDVAALVDKNGFEVGNAEDFSKFIKKKCFFKYTVKSSQSKN